MKLSFFPPNEPDQTVRMQRFLMSFGMYLIAAFLIVGNVYNGITPFSVMVIACSGALIGNVAFYWIFRLGYNKRFKDPSLTAAQILMAIALVMYSQIYGGPSKGPYQMILLITFVFGCFKLQTRQLLILSAAALTVYALTLPVIARVEGARFNLTTELTQWVTTAIMLPFLSVLAGSISKLRRKLSASNAELTRLLQQVTELASHDELTGVYNRRYILEMLAHEKKRVDRSGSSFAICLMDLDHFKQVNDTFGHKSGDTVLKSFADVVKTIPRGADFFGRYGGEEFVLFLPDTPAELATNIVDRVHHALGQINFDEFPNDFRVTVSIGIAQYQTGESIDELIHRADQALYLAKHKGRNRTECLSARQTESLADGI